MISSKPVHKLSLLTKRMIETLMDCHERELMNQEPCFDTKTAGIKGLFARGMLKTSILITTKGKRIVAFYLTDSAKKYLNKLTVTNL